MNTCIATIPSLNMSIKAQRALSASGYYCRIVNIDPHITRYGCAYGIEFSCSEERVIKQILNRNGIRISQILNSGEGRPL